jgi:hypothetical protein
LEITLILRVCWFRLVFILSLFSFLVLLIVYFVVCNF